MGMNTAAVQRLYVAYFNRPADPVSLAVYEALLPSDREATQAELQAIAVQYFSPSAEYQDMYAGKSNAQIVDQLYQNIFGREAEPAGLVAWAADLTSGAQTVASLALQLSYSAQGTDADVVANRIEAATSFTTALDTSDEITGYSGNDAAASARNWLATVGSDTASKDSAIAGVDAAVTSAVAAAPVAGETYNLTTALDAKTLGSGSDQAFATDSATASSDTFNVSDQVDGGAGTDTFSLTLNDSAVGGGGVAYTPSRITNFENLKVTNIDDDTPFTVNASLMGVTAVENAASTFEVNVTNVSAGTSLAVTGVATAATKMTVLGAGLTGTADTASLSLTGAGGAVTIESTTAQDFEALTVVAEGVNTSNVTVDDDGGNAAVTTVTVTGTGSWDMEGGGNLATALTTLDASGNSGGVTFTSSVAGTTLTGGSGNDVLTGAAGNDVISGGAGDDTLVMGSGGIDNVSGGAGNDSVTVAALTEDDTIAGGDGVDTLIIGSAIAYDDESTPTVDTAANISGFEALKATAALTQDLAALDGIVTLQSESGVLTATEADAIGDFFALANNTGLDLTLTTDGAADSLNVHLGSDTAQTGAASVTVDAIEIETALIASKGDNTNTITDFEADALTSLTVIGSKSVSVTLNDSTAVDTIPLTTVDASGFTGDSLTISAVEADSGVTVTTGSEALTVTVGQGDNNITGTAGNDSITTGTGDDTIVSYGGDDTIEAGDGVNVITVTDGENDIDGGEGLDTITVGNGNNTIDGGDGADVIVAGTGANTITNSAGNATITAGAGNNNITNTAGNSTITLGDGANTVNLTAGNSTVVTGDGIDDINITAGNNDITSGGGNDTISLGSGNDTVDAGAGTDSVDFSVERGTWTGAITNAENVTATFTGSASIDAAGISGYTSLTVTASDDTSTSALNNVGSATINLTDDNAEGGGDGNIEAMSIDTTDDATITVNVAGNQEASIATGSSLASLAITDASDVTLKVSGGGFGNLITTDLNTVTLDDEETTSVTLSTTDYTSITEATLSGTESVQSLTIDVEGAESDAVVDGMADAVALTSVSVTADGLNSTLDLEEATFIGDAAESNFAILDTISVTASNGANVDASSTRDATEGDINTQGDVVSVTLSADGTGTTLEAPSIFADGDNLGAVAISATNGATLDTHDADEAAVILNWGYDSLALTTSGTATLEAELVQDEGGISASAESTITIEAGAGSTMDLDDTDLGAVDLDAFTLDIGAAATVAFTESDIEVDEAVGTIDIDVDSTGTFEGHLDIEAAGVISQLDVNLGADGTFGAESDVIDIRAETGSDAVLGITTLNVTLGDLEAATTVDTTSSNLIVSGSQELVTVGDSEGEASDVKFYSGSVTLVGDDNNTVNVSNTLVDSEGDFGGFTVSTGTGNDSITGGEGSDVITTSAGNNTVTGADGNDQLTTGAGTDSVTGGAGNDTIAVGAGADTVGGGAGNDSIDLTENVSAADVVLFSSAVGTSSDSAEVAASSGVIDSGQDTITTFTTGTDTIRVTSTGVLDFVHVTDTDLGEGDATVEGDTSNNYATNVGLINLDGGEADEFSDAGDILINFASPSTTITEALFEAALQYNITAGAGAATITTGGLADTITGAEGIDTIDGGAGVDTYVAGSDGSAISVTLNTSTAATVTVTGSENDSIVNIENVTGTSGADSITGDSAANIITGLAGNDTISGAGGIDNIVFSDTNGTDSITFVRNEDLLDFTSVTSAGTLAKVAVANTAGDESFTVDGTNTTVYVIDTDGVDLDDGSATDDEISDFEAMAGVATFLIPVTANNVSGEVHYFIINDGDDADAAYVYKFTDGGDNAVIDADELQLIGIVASSVAGDVDIDDVDITP